MILNLRARLLIFLLIVAPLYAPSSAWAQSTPSVLGAGSFGKTIGPIEVVGARRIEKDAVLAKLFSKTGAKLSADGIRTDIQSLFAMGFFDDVEVLAEDAAGVVRLIYRVKERPVIGHLEFEGNEQLSDSDLTEVTKVREFSIFDVNKIKEDVALIQKHYEEKGFYLAKVSYEVRPIAGKTDEVELIYRINDYDKVQIKRITFLNNKRFSDDQLKSVLMETREGSLFSFMSGSGNFKESAFKTDLQRLSYWYLDHGYVKFRYENPIVTVSDDKRFLYITIYVDEGEQYSIGAIDFGGDLLFPKEELHSELTLKEAETFGITKRNADIQRLTEKYQDLGYAFVNVIPKMNFREETKSLDLQYDFEKGNLVYFGEINVVGNSKTYDKVVRRELRIRDGELYNGTRLRESREAVERLGYFAPGEVVFNSITPRGKNDVVNIEIQVKERSTGTITLGAGYGSASKFFFTTQVAEINLMGKGQTVSLQAQLAADQGQKTFNLGFTDPYAFDTRWSMGGDLFYVNQVIPDRYSTRKLGFDLRFGYPVYDYTYGFITYKNEGLKINPSESSSIDPDPNDVAADQGVLSSAVFSVIRDKRNNRYETTAGDYQSLSIETAGIGGDKKFIKMVANSRYFKRIVGDLVFRNNLEFGHLYPVGGSPVPPSERFYLGGPNSLKGYPFFGVGPKRQRLAKDGVTLVSESIGGRTEMVGIFELEYPLIREAGLKLVTFFDAGNSFSQFPDGTNEVFKLLTDAGFGFRWFSPIGPLRFEFGYPLDGGPSQFVFFIGPPF